MNMSQEAIELHTYIANDGTMYRQQGQPILKNLSAKMASGKYDHDKAVKLYMYYTEAGAKKYAKEFGVSEWNKAFPVAARKQAAELFAREFETEFKLGNYSAYVPKKYQPKAPARSTAKRVTAKRSR